MTCEWFETLASDALDGELNADEQRLLAAHCSQCQDCAERDVQLRQMRALLQSVPLPAPTPRQTREMFARIHSDERSLLGRLWRLVPRLSPAVVWPSTTATFACLALLAAVLWAPGIPPPPEPPPALALDLPAETLLTVWESQAERIVASSTHLSLLEFDEVGGPFTPTPISSHAVQMFLYERIIVRG